MWKTEKYLFIGKTLGLKYYMELINMEQAFPVY